MKELKRKTVGELIKDLEKFNLNSTVKFKTDDNQEQEINRVYDQNGEVWMKGWNHYEFDPGIYR